MNSEEFILSIFSISHLQHEYIHMNSLQRHLSDTNCCASICCFSVELQASVELLDWDLGSALKNLLLGFQDLGLESRFHLEFDHEDLGSGC